MTVTYPLQVIAGKNLGVSRSSQALIGALLPACGFTEAGLEHYYNISNHNTVLLDTAASFLHSSGLVTLGYVFNSNSDTAWQFRLSSLAVAADKKSATLLTEDGATIQFVKSNDKLYESIGFGIGRSSIEFDSDRNCWIRYSPATQLRHVYDNQGRLVATYRDGVDLTTYSYDSSNRLAAITPPGFQVAKRSYSISYQSNADGTQTQTISVNDSGKKIPLREYLFSKDKLIEKITVLAHGSDPTTDFGMPYVVNLAYRRKADSHWGLESITTENDASSLNCVYGPDSTLTDVQLGLDSPYAIRFDYSKQSQGVTTVNVSSAMQVSITQSGFGVVTQVDNYTGYDSLGAPDTTQYMYDEARVTKKITPDGVSTIFEYATDTDLDTGLLIKKTRASQVITTAYEVIQGRIYKSAETTSSGPGLDAKTSYFVHREIQQRPHYKTDYCVGLAYIVSRDGRVTGFDLDPVTGLASYKRYFPIATYAGTISLDELDRWATDQYKAKAFTLTQFHYQSGSTQLASTGFYSDLTSDGYAIPDDQFELDTREYDVLLRQIKTTKILSYTKDSSGKSYPVEHDINYAYDSFDRLALMHYSEDQLDEINFWQNQVVGSSGMTIQNSIEYQYSHDTDRSVVKTETQPNGRLDITSCNEHGWPVKTDSTNLQGVTRTASVIYDAAGRPGHHISITGKQWWTVYDNQNRLGFQVSSSGYVTQYFHDVVNRYSQVMRYVNPIDLTGVKDTLSGSYILKLLKVDTANDRVSYQFYDDRGNQVYLVDEDNYINEYRYNLLNKSTAHIAYKKPITSDQLAALLKNKDPQLDGPDDSTVIGPATADLYDVNSFYYDGDSNLVFSVDADGFAKEVAYDGAGRVIITRLCGAAYVGTRPQFQAPTIAKTDDDIYSLNYYDTRGRRIIAVDGCGYVTLSNYDTASREIKLTRFYTPLSVATLLADATHTCPENPASSAEDYVISRMYNTQGEVIATRDSAQQGTWSSKDEMGQVLASATYDLMQPNRILSGDSVRAKHTLYSAWQEVSYETNPWIDPQLVTILADTRLTPDQRSQQVSAFWADKSIRTVRVDGLLLKAFNTLHDSAEIAVNAGATINYYNSLDQLVFVIDAVGGLKQLSYNEFGEVLTIRHFINRMDTASDNYQKLQGGLLTNDLQELFINYANAQDVITEKQYGRRGLVELEVDGEGYQTKVTYDFKSRALTVAKSRIATSSFDVNVTNVYDGRDNKLSITTADSADTLSIKKSWEFNHPLDKQTAFVNEQGLKTNYELSKRGLRLIVSNDGPNAGSDRITYKYDAFSRISTHSNTLGEVIQYAYQQNSNTCTVTLPDGIATKLVVSNVFGNSVSQTEAGNTVTWMHDGSAHVVSHTNAIGGVHSTACNSDGAVIQATDTLGRVNQWVRDDLEQVTEFLNDINGRNLKTSYQRDGLSRAIVVTNPRGVAINTTFSKNSQPLVVVLDPGTDTVPGLKETVTRTYDGFNTCLTEVQSGATDSAVYQLAFAQDSLGRPTQKTVDPDGLALSTVSTLNAAAKVVLATDAKGGKSYTIMNVYGLKVFVISADGVCTEHGYDGLNREVVKYVYAAKLPTSVLSQLTVDISVADASALIVPYRGGADTCLAYASEIRSFYDANGSVLYTVKILRTDPHNPATGSACITQNERDSARRLIKRTVYGSAMEWTTEPDWANATITAAIRPDTSQDRTYHYILDAAGNDRYTVDPTGLVTEKCFRADCDVWLIIKYANAVADLSKVEGISLPDMTTLVQGLADANLDRMSGGFKNDKDKPVYAFHGAFGTTVSLVKFVYDGCDNQISEIKFAAAVDLSSRDPDIVWPLFEALKPDSSVDSIVTSEYQNNNALQTVTDAVGNKESYTRDALKLLLTHTDRNGNTEAFAYDGAKRCVKETSPEMLVTANEQTADAKGNLTLTSASATRAVVTDKVYDSISNVTQLVRDSGGANIILNTTYGYSQQAIETTQDDVEIDDASVIDPSLAALPTKSTTISKALYFNGLQSQVIEFRNTIPFSASIYNSLGQERYRLKFNLADCSDVAVIEYRYNTLGDKIWEILYANPLVLIGAWDADWFVNTPIQFLSQIGSVTASAQDRVTYTAVDLVGRPVATYKGLDINNSLPDEDKFTGLVPYVAPLTKTDSDTSPGIGYALTKRMFLGGRVVRESQLVDLQADRWSEELVWYTQSDKLEEAARAVPTRVSFGSETVVCAVTRNVYAAQGLKVSVTKYATLMPLADLEQLASLADLDAYLAKNKAADDRTQEFSYDLNGRVIKVTFKNVTRHQLVMPAKAGDAPTVNQISGDLCRDMKRNGVGDIVANSQLYFGDGAVVRGKNSDMIRVLEGEADSVAWEYYILDPKGQPMWHVGFPVNLGDDLLYPLEEMGHDGLGNMTRVCRYQQGADSTSVGAGLTPKAKAPNAATDPVTLSLYNKRSKKIITVDGKGYVRMSTFDDMDKPARNYQGYTPTEFDGTNFVDAATVVEQTMLNNNRRGHLQSKKIYRDGELKSADYLQYNLFGEDVAMGDDESEPQLRKIYDVLGGLRVTNSLRIRGQQGIACARQLDLMGRLTQEIEATSTDLMQTTVDDLSKADFYSASDLQLTTYYPAEGKGNVLRQLLPETAAGQHLDKTQVPVEISTQVFSDEYGTADLVPLLRWPKACIDNSTLQILLTDSQGKQYTDLTVVDDNLFRSVDVSALPTDNYTYDMTYSVYNVVTDKNEPIYESAGLAPIVTAQAPASGSSAIIPFVRDDSTIYFAGVIADYSKVNLYSSDGVLVTTLALNTDAKTGYKVADASALVSALYAPTLVDSSGKETAKLTAVVVNTALAPAESLSWSIPATASLIVSDDKTTEKPTVGTLAIWATFPPALRKKSVSLTCQYVDTDGVDQKQDFVLTPDDLTAVFDFDNPVKSISTITVELVLDASNSIEVYNNEAPTASTDLTFNFADKRYCLMRGPDFLNQGNSFAIQYKDTSKGQKSTWVDMIGLGMPIGVLFDVSAFANSNYPFVKAGGDTSNPPYLFTVSRGGIVVTSDSQLVRLRTATKSRPDQLFGYDAFRNRTKLTDACGNEFNYQYNDLDKQITKTDPEVSIYNDQYDLVPDNPVTQMYYGAQSDYIAREYPLGGIEAIEHDAGGNIMQVMDADGLSIVANKMNALSQMAGYTRFGSVNTLTYDLNGNQIEHNMPNPNPGSYGKDTITTSQEFNEKNKLKSTTDGNGGVTYYNEDVWDNITTRWTPEKNRYDQVFYLNMLQKRTRPDGKVEIWSASSSFLNYVGIWDSYTDLGGTVTNVTFNKRLQKITQQSGDVSDLRGNYTQATPYTNNGCFGFEYVSYSLDTKSQVKQDISYSWDVNNLSTITDNATGLLTENDFDFEGRQVYSRLSRLAGTTSRHTYIRHRVAGDGDCGFTALGFTREDVLLTLQDHVDTIRELLKPALQEALLTDKFYNHLLLNRVIDTSQSRMKLIFGFSELPNELLSGLYRQYLLYDVRDRSVDAGYAHPAVLQALAHIRGVSLRMWLLGENGELKPHRSPDYDYAEYVSPTADKPRPVDLLFVRGNHFELLESANPSCRVKAGDISLMAYQTKIVADGVVDGVIHEAASLLDALGRPVMQYDNIMSVNETFDLNGSLVRRVGTQNDVVYGDDYFTYTAAKRLLIANGILDETKKVVVTTSSQGMTCGYTDDSGNMGVLRTLETYSDGTKNVYVYNTPDGRISKMTTYDGKVTTFWYDNARLLREQDGPDDNTQSQYNGEYSLTQQYCTKDNTTSKFQYNSAGEAISQETTADIQTVVNFSDNTMHIDYGFNYDLGYHGSTSFNRSINAYTKDKYGTKWTSSASTVDPNGNLNTIIGSNQGQGSDYQPNTIYMTVGNDGLIRMKTSFPQEINASSTAVRLVSSDEALFYSANNGNYFGEYTCRGLQVVAGGHLSRPSNTGLREVLSTKSSKLSELAESDLHAKQSTLPRNVKPPHYSNRWQEILHRLTPPPTAPGKIGQADPNNERVHHYIQSIKDLKPWNHQQSIVVGYGETFEAIARNYTGSVDAALDVALANGFSGDALITQRTIFRRIVTSVSFLQYSKVLCGDAKKAARSMILAARHVMPSVFMLGNPRYVPLSEHISESDWQTWHLVGKLKERLAEADGNPLAIGQVIMLPQYTPSTYDAESATPLSGLMSEIEGSFLPHLVWAQKKHHWWEVFFRIFIQIIDIVVSVAVKWTGPLADGFITAATDALLQGFFYEVGLLSDFSWEEVMGAAMTGALAPGADSSTGIGGIMRDAAHFKNITAVAEGAGIVALENTTIQLASMAVGMRKHFSISEVLTSVTTFAINGMANAEIDLIRQSKLLSAVEKSLADAGFDEVYGSAIMGREPSLDSALDQFAMNLGNYVGQAIADEIKVASEPKEQKSSAYKPIDVYAETKRAIQKVWAQSYAQSTSSDDIQSLDNASQAHDTMNSKDFSYGDWYKETLVYAKAASHFNKSEAASGFMNPENDFAGYMNMLTDQVIPIPGREYRHYAESSPTSMQPKVVDLLADRISHFLYDYQSSWYGELLLGAIGLMGSQAATQMALGAERVASYAKPMNPIVEGVEMLSGVDFYTGESINRAMAATNFTLDMFGGEMIASVTRGLGLVLRPAMNSSVATMIIMGARLGMESVLESPVTRAVLGPVDSTLVQPLRGALEQVGIWRANSLPVREATNHISGLRLQRSLQMDQAKSIFNKEVGLKPEIISNSDLIVRGDQLRNADIIDALTKKGGNLSDWGKYTTKSIPSPSGNFQMHFYYNPVTGDSYYGMDFKAVFDHQGSWNLNPTPNFEYEPPQYRSGF